MLSCNGLRDKMSKKVNCKVEEENTFGNYANAFRLLFDGKDIVLDFCLYSELAGKAQLISRVRISEEFLPVIIERLESSLKNLTTVNENIYVFPNALGEQ